MVPEILTLGQITDASSGGKAYGLSRLAALGVDVPSAFVIHNARADIFPENLQQSYLDLGGGRVAVRSSALGEDGDEASFAGQYDSVLNVEGEADYAAPSIIVWHRCPQPTPVAIMAANSLALPRL